LVDSDYPPTDPSAWTGGVIAVVSAKSIWVDTERDELKVLEDYDHDGTAEVRVLADRVVDLQAALGYDVSPWDWQITNSNDNEDEWLYNAPGDTIGENDGQGLAEARWDELRMVRVGLIVGIPVQTAAAEGTCQILNGPPRQRMGELLRSTVGTTSMRNHDVMR
jgi:hypothetical protein